MDVILVVNAGSSSVKVAVFDGTTEVISGAVSEIGGAARLKLAEVVRDLPVNDHRAAVATLLTALDNAGYALARFTAAAHRVVHGGASFVAPCRISSAVIAGIEACVPLAPLHNPANLAAIRALADLAPDLPQYASFDTAFHATAPEVATRYALPDHAEALGIRRYGFHGLSYAALPARLTELTGHLPRRVLAYHLGNGASACALREGRSVATSMGYSPLEGLTMGTRSGSIDGMAVLRLAEAHGIEGAGRILNRESGLLGLGGASNMRSLLASGEARARFAVAHFIYWAVRHGGSLIAAMGGLDAVVFTGGIGENAAPVRAGILDGLAFAGVAYDPVANVSGQGQLHKATSDVAVWIVAAEEERQIAAEALMVRERE